jgi:hypothetical protein
MKDAAHIIDSLPLCEHHFIVKKIQLYQSKQQTQKIDQSRITIEFCTWLQKTEVFDLFTDHLNNGISLKYVDVNRPQVSPTSLVTELKSKAKGV